MKTRFPIVITHNGVIAKIHRSFQIQKGEKYNDYLVVYKEGYERKRIRRSTLEAAQIAAKNACNRVQTGQHLSPELKNGEHLMYLRAIEPLKAIGVSLDVAAVEYANARKRLPRGTTIQEAVDYFCRQNVAIQEIRTVQQVVDDMLEAKEAAKMSDAYLHDLKTRLTCFADYFKMNIGEVSGSMLQSWLDKMKVSGRSKQNYFKSVAALIRFAIRRKWLPKEAFGEVEAVQLPKDKGGEIKIFSPDEMTELLTVAKPAMVPWLAIAAFAGLRSAEIDRLDWSEINLSERFIEIKAHKAKTSVRRLAPITDNLAEWLAPYAKSEGGIVNIVTWWNEFPKIARAVNKKRKVNELPTNFKWRHNALRHSFCSYRVASIKNANQVAYEAGNSVRMIDKHYRKVVTEAQAAQWFSIVPSNN